MLTAMALQHVIEPQMSTLAGGMGGLIYWADSGELIYLDAELDHAQGATTAHTLAGLGAVPTTSGARIGVPGTVPGMAAAAERFGTLDWRHYFGPAIDAAESGFPMYSFLYGEMSAANNRLGVHEASAEIWLPDGFVPRVGDIIKQPVLAATLRRLADEGPSLFTAGDWAKNFVTETNRTGGTITLDELANYQPRWVEPVHFSYHGVEMRGAPPASTAGVLNGMIFNILERHDLRSMGHFANSADSFDLIRKAFAQAEAFTNSFIQDPLAADVPVEALLSKSFAEHLSGIVDNASMQPLERAAFHNGGPEGKSAMPPSMYTDTNHLTIVDSDGNWVAMTHTVYGDTFGTGLTVDGVGVNSGNNFPGRADGDGRRVITPFPALMAVDDDGIPFIALGSPGLSSRAVALTLINHIGYGMDPYASVDAPRFVGYAFDEDLHVESRIDAEVLDALAARDVAVKPSAPYNWHMGSIQLVVRDRETGTLTGVADPRRGGHAAGL